MYVYNNEMKHFIYAIIGYLIGVIVLIGLAINMEPLDTLREGILITPFSEDYSNGKATLNDNFAELENEHNETTEDIDSQFVQDYLGIPDEIDDNGYLWRYFTDEEETSFILVNFDNDELVQELSKID
ncbi:hypothetical protein TMUPMC115_1296 [Tetragenococcus muriaticus PMC-11-5]|uniref:Uncharacterized protein n=4 Tax=Tetragenococcus muriaticus TaxID=64642 RepID=A0A091C4V9_9ENTE|nr:hypothetical protein TMU3MR103_1157 [Tetragenococcus muriaticus 3MR10-3]KFN91609.1 hypothetical protein TMUPMC115_1296 [Tetragenococcus muriaticus PMC-11-5]GMA47195.1 hypothetical protein GCM10025854_14450 [Tetragenococcus muriaticus]